MTPSVPKHINFYPKFDLENPVHCSKASTINFVKLFAEALFTTCYLDSKIRIHFYPSTTNTCNFTQLWQSIVCHNLQQWTRHLALPCVWIVEPRCSYILPYSTQKNQTNVSTRCWAPKWNWTYLSCLQSMWSITLDSGDDISMNCTNLCFCSRWTMLVTC